MKKLLTVLLTLVMVVCLVNLNSKYSKADGNASNHDVTYNSSGSWEGITILDDYIPKGDTITITNQHATKNVVVTLNYNTDTIVPNTSKVYKLNYGTEKKHFDPKDQDATICIKDFGINCEYSLTYNNGNWYYGANKIDEETNPKLSYFGIFPNTATTPQTATLNRSLKNPGQVIIINQSVNLNLGDDIRLYSSNGQFAINPSVDISINGNGKTLSAESTNAPVIYNDGIKIKLENIIFLLKDNVGASCVKLKDLDIGDNCIIEITQGNNSGHALYLANELSDNIKNKYDILGKVNPDDGDDKLKPATYNNTTHIYQVEGDDTDGLVDARYILIKPKKQPSPAPTPSPSKKDESCEKVIGPTWHWNNDKGICEEYATVGTSTR